VRGPLIYFDSLESHNFGYRLALDTIDAYQKPKTREFILLACTIDASIAHPVLQQNAWKLLFVGHGLVLERASHNKETYQRIGVFEIKSIPRRVETWHDLGFIDTTVTIIWVIHDKVRIAHFSFIHNLAYQNLELEYTWGSKGRQHDTPRHSGSHTRYVQVLLYTKYNHDVERGPSWFVIVKPKLH
jgi:hypothetical protein